MTEAQTTELLVQLKAINEHLGRIAEALSPVFVIQPWEPDKGALSVLLDDTFTEQIQDQTTEHLRTYLERGPQPRRKPTPGNSSDPSSSVVEDPSAVAETQSPQKL